MRTSPGIDRDARSSTADIVIVGTGFSGLAMAERLRRAGNRDFLMLERGDDVGGTWRDNSYPGCACDVPSHLYSFSFAPNPDWSSTYSGQAEIWAYIRKVARDRGLVPQIRFNCNLEAASWDGAAGCWRLQTSQGPITARVLVTASGALSDPAIPALPGLDRFRGRAFHSATWDHDYDLTGKRVAVVGTGASAVQFIPEIQPRVGSLAVFQRTASWIVPRSARPLSAFEHALYRALPFTQRAMRAIIYAARELIAIPLLRVRLSPLIRLLAQRHLSHQVPDPGLRRQLTPNYAPGCKRILISNDFLPALGRPNVEVVTAGIAEVREHSIVTVDGVEREVDAIIFGTGFHVTDWPLAERIRGRDGRSMAEASGGSLRALRGTTVPGFPNLFVLLGPNTGLGHTSVVVMAEAQAGYVARAIEHMDRHGIATVEATEDAHRSWNRMLQTKLVGTVWNAGGCRSWYLDRSGVNTTIWPDFSFRFVAAMRRFEVTEYATSAVPGPVIGPLPSRPGVAA
jgi:cation diffusion facilitator CzcD-associated flavoprotein CzcO